MNNQSQSQFQLCLEIYTLKMMFQMLKMMLKMLKMIQKMFVLEM
ncbi:hypothetical protein Hanom_Chr06g00515561 [Helianthus anomalus]